MRAETFLARWEVSSFEPCDRKERWWASFEAADGQAIKTLIEQAQPPGAEVELCGTVSEPGNYGHMGLYDREFRVHQIGQILPRPLPVEESE
jgi:hypothetical protein